VVVVVVQEGGLSRKLHVGACPRQFLRKHYGIAGFVGARSGSIFAEILMSDVFFDDFELRDRYGDVGHHLLVQDAPSFMQKSMILIYVCSFLHVYAFQKSACYSLISMFWPFPGLLVPTMTSASKNQHGHSRSRVQLLQFDAVYVWSRL
jgi:hypothetical protein